MENFVNLTITYQIWVTRHYMAIPLKRSIAKGLLEYCYLVCLIQDIWQYFLVYFSNNKFDYMVQFAFHSEPVFLYENHCECNLKLASRLWPVPFTLMFFFLYKHSRLPPENKKLLFDYCFFFSKLYHRAMFSYLCYETIQVPGSLSI